MNESQQKKQTFYWLYNPITQMTKLGITNNLKRRFKQIENACGCELSVIATLEFEHAQKLESLFLAIFKHYKTKGEWFKFDNIQESHELIYNTLKGLCSNRTQKWFFGYHLSINDEEFISTYMDIKKETRDNVK